MNEKVIWTAFKEAGMTDAGAAGLMGNLFAESGLNPGKCEKLCLNRLREYGVGDYTDESYTAAVDSGAISKERFLHPLEGKRYGYGLAQWTTEDRKGGLYKWTVERGYSIADLDQQLKYLIAELKECFKGAWKILTEASDVDAVSDYLLYKYEMPANPSQYVNSRRGYSELYLEKYGEKPRKEQHMGFDREKVIEIAKAEEGYLEKSAAWWKAKGKEGLYYKEAGAGSDNYTKYGYEMHKLYPSVMDFPAAWCFTAGTMLLTDKGYKTIESICIGDKVLNAYGNKFNTVVDVATRIKKVRDIKAYGTLPMQTTDDHPFLSTKRLGVRKDWKHTPLDFNPAENLRHGDNVVIPKTQIIKQLNITYDEAWLIGYFVGDGWISSRGTYNLCANDEKERMLLVHAPHIHKDKDYPSRTCHEYKIDKDFYKSILPILNDAGKGAANKHVPEAVLYAANSIKQAFLDGYMAADGTKGGKFNTVSKALALGISKLVFDLGYGLSLRECVRKENQVIFDKRINSYRQIKIKPIIYCGAINKSVDKAHRMDRTVDDLVYVPIKSNISTETELLVYNISTDGDHTYLANNLAVHNCDSTVDWCFMQAYGVSNAKKLLGGDFDDYTVASAQLYKDKGAWRPAGVIPERGWQIFFKNSSRICHTGLVVDVVKANGVTYVYTVEGNTSSEAGVVANGGCVRRKKYRWDYDRIAGYGVPAYDDDTVQAKIEFTPHWVRDGAVWYYREAEGKNAHGWKLINSRWYYFDEKGRMQTGRIFIEGRGYYLATLQDSEDYEGACMITDQNGQLHVWDVRVTE